MARTVITDEKISEINELYQKIGTYSGVAKILGIAPSTVKKYIIPGFLVNKDKNFKNVFKREDLPEFSTELFKNLKNWGDICSLSDDEKEEIRVLWEDMVI